jgi:hypothetical protein
MLTQSFCFIEARPIEVLDDEVNKKGEIPSKKTKLDVQEEDKRKIQPTNLLKNHAKVGRPRRRYLPTTTVTKKKLLNGLQTTRMTRTLNSVARGLK